MPCPEDASSVAQNVASASHSGRWVSSLGLECAGRRAVWALMGEGDIAGARAGAAEGDEAAGKGGHLAAAGRLPRRSSGCLDSVRPLHTAPAAGARPVPVLACTVLRGVQQIGSIITSHQDAHPLELQVTWLLALAGRCWRHRQADRPLQQRHRWSHHRQICPELAGPAVLPAVRCAPEWAAH